MRLRDGRRKEGRTKEIWKRVVSDGDIGKPRGEDKKAGGDIEAKCDFHRQS